MPSLSPAAAQPRAEGLAMTSVPLWAVLATVRRFPLRAAYTFTMLALAFVLFSVLRSIVGAYSGPPQTDVLQVSSRGSYLLPDSAFSRISSMPDIVAVTPFQALSGYYREPRDHVPAFGVAPAAYFRIFGAAAPPSVYECFARIRHGAIVAGGLDSTFEWERGDSVTLSASWPQKKDGSGAWEFHLCGGYSEAGEDYPTLLFNYDYLRESAEFHSGMSSMWAKVRSGADVALAAEAIDRHFANSSNPTRTVTADELERLYARRVGDVNTIAGALMASFLFSVVVVVQCMYGQAVMERGRELRIMEALGFTRGRILGLAVLEATLLAGVAAAAGLLGGYLATPLVSGMAADVIGEFGFSSGAIWESCAIAVLMGALLGLVAAWRRREERGPTADRRRA